MTTFTQPISLRDMVDLQKSIKRIEQEVAQILAVDRVTGRDAPFVRHGMARQSPRRTKPTRPHVRRRYLLI
jgi:hypothetical protein